MAATRMLLVIFGLTACGPASPGASTVDAPSSASTGTTSTGTSSTSSGTSSPSEDPTSTSSTTSAQSTSTSSTTATQSTGETDERRHQQQPSERLELVWSGRQLGGADAMLAICEHSDRGPPARVHGTARMYLTVSGEVD